MRAAVGGKIGSMSVFVITVVKTVRIVADVAMPSTLFPPTRSFIVAVMASATVVRAIAFWLAVGLALAYPLVFVIADTTAVDQTTIVGIVALHLVTVLVGHGYTPDTEP